MRLPLRGVSPLQALAEYRSTSMRLGYLALDRPDLGYACKEMPMHLHDDRQVRAETPKCGRYLRVPRLTVVFARHQEPDQMTC